MPGTWRSEPFSPSSPQKARPSVQRGAQLAGGDEQADGDREVEAGAALAHARGRQVDRDPSQRPGQAAREDGGAHAVARLAHRGVGQADDGEAGQPVGDVDLDRDRAADGTAQRGGGDRGEHGGERSHQSRFRSLPCFGEEQLATWVSSFGAHIGGTPGLDENPHDSANGGPAPPRSRHGPKGLRLGMGSAGPRRCVSSQASP